MDVNQPRKHPWHQPGWGPSFTSWLTEGILMSATPSHNSPAPDFPQIFSNTLFSVHNQHSCSFFISYCCHSLWWAEYSVVSYFVTAQQSFVRSKLGMLGPRPMGWSNVVRQSNSFFSVWLLNGPLQANKSTKKILKNILHVSLSMVTQNTSLIVGSWLQHCFLSM